MVQRHTFVLVILSTAAAASILRAAPTTAPAPAPELTKDQLTFFESKVRPLLAGRCYKCHSVEEKKAKGGLVLDTRDGWHKGGEGGAVILPGDPGKSRLLTAVKYADPDLQMPPDDQLPDNEVAILEQWIKMGAPDPRIATADQAAKLTGLTEAARAHWAYQPVKPQAVPTVPADLQDWVNNPIDAFIAHKLHAHGLKPSDRASKEALIRRATYDLIGLPPTPAEVKSFVTDKSPDAFVRVVDRLLASPHYGERWGRFWLDTARYSDTTGNEDNNRGEYRFPYAWTYRDYVIKSFNEDKPYDRFLREQLAADLMPETRDDPAKLAALGFITVGKRFQNPNDTIDERIDAVSKGTMALTVSCARCHDHKFDPIPTADYYSLHGIFASTTEPTEKPMIGSTPDGPEYDDFLEKVQEREAKSRAIYFDVLKKKGSEFRKKASAYLLATAINPRRGSAELLKLRYDVIEKEKLDRDIYQGGLGRRIRPNDAVFAPLFMFAQVKPDDFESRAPNILSNITRAGERDADGSEGGDRPGRRRPMQAPQRQRINPLVVKAFAAVEPDSLKDLRGVCDVYGKLFAEIDDKAAAYLRACESAENDGAVSGYDADLVELIGSPSAVEPAFKLTPARLIELAPTLPLVNQQGYQRLQLAGFNQLLLTHPGSPGRAMVVADSDRPRNSPILIRGEQQNRGQIVPRRFLEVLSPPKRLAYTSGSGRLELAKAIATKDNPLTARVAVNRIWLHHFGQAFVRTPDDLGVQCEPPSHPELLDWLAARFVEDGWSFKKMHRLIMLSNAYQQSSETSPAGAKADPDNRLLWRANLRRLDFEAIRDSILMFTGKLDPILGGKPVNLTDEPYSNRRSVYGYIDRGDLPELMSQFDFADPDMANSARTTTIVPQQALFFMNSPMAVDAARKVTARPEFASAKNDTERVMALYEVVFQRKPRPEEVSLARRFVQASTADEMADQRKLAANMTPEEQTKQARRAEQQRQAKEKRMLDQAMNRRGARSAITNTGTIVERKPLTAWEQYAQALLFTNEIAYVN